MSLTTGNRVRSKIHPEWGLGELLEDCTGDKARVLFEKLGERSVLTSSIHLVEGEKAISDRLDRLKEKLRISERITAKQLPPVSRDHFIPSDKDIQLGKDVGVNFSKVFTLCEHFYFEMHDNRPNCNDGSLALNIVDDLRRRGHLSYSTEQQLAAWCTTNGTVYQRGVPIAHNISLAIYGRILRREE